MKAKHSLLFLLLIGAYAAKSQSSFRKPAISKEPVTLDAYVEKIQPKQVPSNYLITPNTIISREEKVKGQTTITAYIDRQFIFVVCPGITMANVMGYKAFGAIMGSRADSVDDKDLEPVEFLFFEDSTAILASAGLNENKLKWPDARRYYCIKDKAGKIVSSLVLQFIFPKPELQFISLHDSLIKAYRAQPLETTELSPNDVTRFMKGISSDGSKIAPTSTLLFRFKSLTRERNYRVEYQLNADVWKASASDTFPYFIIDGLTPGKYKLQVRYLGEKNNVMLYEFEILPTFIQTTSFKIVMGCVITALVLGALFWGYSILQKQKLKKEIAKRKQLQDQITALQARLQPHFIFNALNSIQGLINKRNIEDANIYMSKFGALLHEIIGKSGQTMHPLATEIKQIEYYLQLEQLRFKFQYKIAINESIDTSEINIPTMLLQPYVENAIKHGIVEKKEAGLVEITIEKNNNNLEIAVRDNGKGYDTAVAPEGLGNAMVEERIGALNKLLKEQQITVAVQSAIDEGTTVLLIFTNWL